MELYIYVLIHERELRRYIFDYDNRYKNKEKGFLHLLIFVTSIIPSSTSLQILTFEFSLELTFHHIN